MSELLVEGELDNHLLFAVFEGRPVVSRGGSKNALKPKVEDQRSKGKSVAYIRDRDFDIDPPLDRSRPAIHKANKAGEALGWYWCRHEMENYLLEPSIVTRAAGCDDAGYRTALLEAAKKILDFQAARAAIGITRRDMPPAYELQTRPSGGREDSPALPADLSKNSVFAWAREQASSFRDRLCPQLDPSAIQKCIDQRASHLSSLVGSVEDVLVWYAGKDLLAALEPWLALKNLGSRGEFRNKLKGWFVDHPKEAVELLPEWKELVRILQP